jgi:DNA repair photolyase
MTSLPLLPDCESDSNAKLIGIARLASQGESLRQGHEVEYFTLPVRSLLNRCTGMRMPFTWTINPYRGCEFACKYCYARYTHEFMEMRDGVDFEQKIFVKQHAANLLRQELHHVKPGEEIALGTATDPYQPAERRFEVTRAILEEFARHRGLEIGIVTKSNLVVRDIDVLQQIAQNNRLVVNITITTLKVDLARVLEPRAPRPDLRLDALQKLSQAGVAAGVICAPVLPGITDSPRDLEAVVQASAKAGGKHIFANSLFLKPCSAAVFLPFLEKEFPQLVESYRQRYKDSAFLSASYRKRLSQLMARLREKHGMRNDYDRYRERSRPVAKGAEPGEQLNLF